MKRFLLTIALWFVLTTVSTAARAQFSGTDFEVGSVRAAQTVEQGTVIDVVDSTIHVEAPAAARIGAAAITTAVCGQASRKWQSWTARGGVLTACGAAGERIGAQLGSRQVVGHTFIVRLDTGRTVGVMQADGGIQVGDRVYLLRGRGDRILRAKG